MATKGSIVITTNNTAISIFMPEKGGPKTAGIRLLKTLSDTNQAVLEDKTDMVQIVNPEENVTPQHKQALKPYTTNSTRCKKYAKWVDGLHGNLNNVLNAGVYVEIDDYLDDSVVEWVYHVDIPQKVVSTIRNTKDESTVFSRYSLTDIPHPEEYKELF